MRVISQKNVKKWSKMDCTPTIVEISEQVLVDGIYETRIKHLPLEDVDVRDSFIDRDFSLNNLIAAGATDQLKEVGTIHLNSIDAADMVSGTIDLNSIAQIMSATNTDNTKEEDGQE